MSEVGMDSASASCSEAIASGSRNGRCGVPGYPHPCSRLSAHAAPPTVGKKARESDATALAAPLDLPR